MTSLITIISAIAGLILLILGGMIPAAILLPTSDLKVRILELPTTWQISVLLYCSLVFGLKSSFVTTIGYIIVGIFFVPVFYGGGSTGYLATPEFGYIIGFIPASLLISNLTDNKKNNQFLDLLYTSLIGLTVIHVSGIFNIILGVLTNRFNDGLLTLVYSYSLRPIPFQLLLCPSIAILARITRVSILKR